MSSREFYLQRDLFTGELVDNRSEKQKRRAQEREIPQQEEGREQDLDHSIVKHTYPLPGLSEGADRKVRLVEQGETKPAEAAGLNQPPTYQDHEAFKEQYPDAIILYRLGDFFETFDDDAKTIAHELDLVLTSRVGKNKRRIPMAGMPCHAAERHVIHLIEKGYTVAVCERVRNE